MKCHIHKGDKKSVVGRPLRVVRNEGTAIMARKCGDNVVSMEMLTRIIFRPLITS